MALIRNNSQINKSSRLPNGVSRVEERDYRLRHPKIKICFSVLVYVDGEAKLKRFRVGKKVSEETAQKTAIAFREYYEMCEKQGIKMNYNAFDDWNK